MRYTKENEWVEVKDGVAAMGITTHAQEQLGDVVSVELPAKGRQVKQGESIAMVDSMKASSDVYAPLSGEVTEANEALNSSPQLVNESAQDKGWFVKIRPSDLKELDKLMTEEEYAEYAKGLKH